MPGTQCTGCRAPPGQQGTDKPTRAATPRLLRKLHAGVGLSFKAACWAAGQSLPQLMDCRAPASHQPLAAAGLLLLLGLGPA